MTPETPWTPSRMMGWLETCDLLGNDPIVPEDEVRAAADAWEADRKRLAEAERLVAIAVQYVPIPMEYLRGAVEDELRDWHRDAAALAPGEAEGADSHEVPGKDMGGPLGDGNYHPSRDDVMKHIKNKGGAVPV